MRRTLRQGYPLLQGQRGLEPSWVAAYFHLGNPLDPAVPAMARGDEPQREAVLGGKLFIPDVCGQQEIAGLIQGKATAIAGGGAEQEAARTNLVPGPLQQSGHRHPTPALYRVPATGTVERGLANVAAEGEELLVGEVGFALDLAVNPELPAGRVEPRDRVAQPVGDREMVAGEARFLARTGEAA